MNPRKYFGTDGIRGHVGTWPITAEFMLRLGRAVGVALAGEDGRATVLIGKDTRVSGYMFESALESGLVAAGAHVQLLGPMPTPAVAYLTHSLRADAGIVISASHNPHQDNGVKFFSAAGEKLDDAVEEVIEREVDAEFVTVASTKLGKALRVTDADARYVEFCKATLPRKFNLAGMHVVLDCAHGATYHVAPRVFAELGARIDVIGAQPDGFNINHEVGSMHTQALRQAVLSSGADLGIAFDGDGDRVQMIDRNGVQADGDDMLYMLARDWHKRGLLRGPVVGTLMSNFGLEQVLQGMGVPLIRAQVGDRHVMQQLKAHGGVLGGETSGHILCLDRTTTGDGIISSLAVLEALVNQDEDLASAREGLHKLPQSTRNVRATGGRALVASAPVQAALQAVKDKLDGHGRVVLRPSGTEPVIRVTIETADAKEVETLVDFLAEAVKSADAEA